MTWEIRQGDALDKLREMPDCSVQMCATSPPYYCLRDYGITGQIGLEETPEAYVAKLVEVFREVRRVLRDDGTCWLNLGDSYNGSGKAGKNPEYQSHHTEFGKPSTAASRFGRPTKIIGLKPKDLIGIPWMVAFALRTDGWYLRSDIIWHKPNPMPESITDRPTKSHEYVFLLTKQERYYYDAEAIKEPMAESSITRLSQPTLTQQEGSNRVPGKTNEPMKAVGHLPKQDTLGKRTYTGFNASSISRVEALALRNKRSVWTVSTQPYKEAHFATWPPKLVEIMVKAGSKEGDTVLDPFSGAATTGLVALSLGRNYLGIELNPKYIEISKRRLDPVNAYQPELSFVGP